MPYASFRVRVFARSRIIARSGIKPTYQNRAETAPYTLTAKTSQRRGLLKLGHMLIWFGSGNIQYATQTRPTWIPGKVKAHITAKMVMASAARLIEVRHFCRKRKRMAEMSVPACPMPTQNTKFVMSHAQPTGTLRPQTPMPSQKSHETATPSRPSSPSAGMKQSHQPSGVGPSTTPATGLSSSSASVWATPGSPDLERSPPDASKEWCAKKSCALYYRATAESSA